MSDDVGWLVKRHPEWKSIGSIGVAEASREVQTERWYFISSLPADAVCAPWGIEKSLHYVLDVAFWEDESRIRKEKGAEDMAILRKIALTVARSDTKSSIIGRRKQMAWSNEYLERLLFFSELAPA